MTMSLRRHSAQACEARVNDVRPLPLMQVAARVRQNFGDLNADLEMGGFGPDSRGLVRELYASVAATAVATHQTEAETLTWAIGRALAVDLYASWASRSASTLVAGLIELGNGFANEKSLELLRRTKEAFDQTLDRPFRAGPGAKPLLRPDQAEASFLARSLQAIRRKTFSPDAASTVDPDQNYVHRLVESRDEEIGNARRKHGVGLAVPSLFARIDRDRGRSALSLLGQHQRVRAFVIGTGATVALAGFLAYSLMIKEESLRQHPSLASFGDTPTPSPVVPAAASGNATSGDLSGVKMSDELIERMVRPWARGVKEVSKTTFQQFGLWLSRFESEAKGMTTTPANESKPLLDLKTHGGAVEVQARLKSLGYYHHKVDGKWGRKSAAALSSFRLHAGLGSNSVWDLTTQSALMGEEQ